MRRTANKLFRFNSVSKKLFVGRVPHEGHEVSLPSLLAVMMGPEVSEDPTRVGFISQRIVPQKAMLENSIKTHVDSRTDREMILVVAFIVYSFLLVNTARFVV